MTKAKMPTGNEHEAKPRGPRGRFVKAQPETLAAPSETAAETPLPAAQRVEKDEQMANQTEKTTKTQAEAFFAQASDRTRESMAQGTKAIEEMNDLARGNIDALVAAGRAAQAGIEKMAHSGVEFSRKSIEHGTAAFRTLASAKTPHEFFAAQNEFAKAQFDGLATEMARTSETMVKVMGEVFEPLSNRMAVAVDRVAKTGAR